MDKFLVFTALFTFLAACNQNSDNVKISNKEHLLFVGSYTDNEGHVDGKADGISTFTFNEQDGSLKKGELNVTTTNPSYLAIDSENKRVYAVNEKVGVGEEISAFSYAEDSMVMLNKVNANGGAPCYILIEEDFVLTANYVGGNHSVYKLKQNGSLGELTDLIQHKGKGLTDRQESPHAHMITKNPHTDQFLTADLGTDFIRFYELEKSSGNMNEVDSLRLAPGSGPRHIDFHPEKDIIYVINELNGSVSVVAKKEDSYFVIQNITTTKMGDPTKAGCADIHIHPSGQFLYGSNRGIYNSIVQYAVSKDGILTMIGEVSSGGDAPRSFTIDPTGKFLLVANQNSNNIVLFSINQETGILESTGKIVSSPTPVCLKFE